MKVTVEYTAQLKQTAGLASEEVEVESGSTVQQLMTQLAENHGENLKGMLFDADGKLQPSLLLFVGDEQVQGDSAPALVDGSVITILSPISGG